MPEDPAAEWATVLIDTARMLPASFGPGDLHNIADARASRSPTAWPSASWCSSRPRRPARGGRRQRHAARASSPRYRSHERQADLYERRVDELGDSEAGSRVARPGHSEHQLGTTIDVTTEGETDVDQSWGATPTGQWVATNAHEYGFLLSYPLDASERTCYDYEPWHLRYVGPRAGRRGHRERPQPPRVPLAAQPRRHHRRRNDHDNTTESTESTGADQRGARGSSRLAAGDYEDYSA